MKITGIKIPDISQYMQYTQSVQLSSDVTVLIVYKTLFRSDDVLVDIYLNEISENTIITSGRLLVNEATLARPKNDIGFKYSIYCYDIDDVNSSINKYNAYKFYLQFTTEEGKEWVAK